MKLNKRKMRDEYLDIILSIQILERQGLIYIAAILYLSLLTLYLSHFTSFIVLWWSSLHHKFLYTLMQPYKPQMILMCSVDGNMTKVSNKVILLGKLQAALVYCHHKS